MFSFVSCTDDVVFNDPSFQGIKDGENWRATDARVILNDNGTMTVEAYSQFEIVKFICRYMQFLYQAIKKHL